MTYRKVGLGGIMLATATAIYAQTPITDPSPLPSFRLAEPVADPLNERFDDDPIVRHLNETAETALFRQQLGDAVRRNTRIDQARALRDEAEAARREARSDLFPTLDLGVSTRTSFAREFSNDPDNLIERSRSTSRTDATFSLQQRVLDFGAASMRIAAARQRIISASHELENQAEQVALRAIAAWYDVFAYRSLVMLAGQVLENYETLREALQERISRGVSAAGDLAQIDSYIANIETQLAGARRELANAEVRYIDFFGAPAPRGLTRAPLIGGRFASMEAVQSAALANPQVDIAAADARAALQEARAARAETLPTVTAGVEGGRFGIFENDNDYDVRGTITVRHRFFGGGDARADGAAARARGAEARAAGIREEAVRQAVIAWTDLNALEDQLGAASDAYFAGRQSRDVVLERFRYSRGSLFEVISAEDTFFAAANSYLRTVNEYDVAHYLLLARTGRLLSALDIDPGTLAEPR
ncbi:TolC family protein [Parasphingopyxis marina]|uniref:TolC family protein n=1 Tax=Parasphingopyxis marina TaxID=2761622 RepID=A0A842HU12_9SPHN|nr:TolC family protein [Parasphingopyxis marina]MBC2776023.1 TolC family protein [Parasphingopyxis marina]